MVIFTSYYGTRRAVPSPVAISLKVPEDFRGEQFPELAPTAELEAAYATGKIDEDRYIFLYRRLLEERRLTPDNIVRRLPFTCTLMCWEKPYQFCHRHIAAKWIYDHTGILVREYGRHFIRGGLGIFK